MKAGVLPHRLLRHQLEQDASGIEEDVVLIILVGEALDNRQPQLLCVEFDGCFDIVGYDRDLVNLVYHF